MIPTLLIVGNHDMVKLVHTNMIATSSNHSKRLILEGTHFVANKKPMLFNASLDAFLMENTKTLK